MPSTKFHIIYLIFYIYLLILAMPKSPFLCGLSLVAASRATLVAIHSLLISVASPDVNHRL